jgi:hypothetical protein
MRNKYQKEIDSEPGSVFFVRFRAWATFHFLRKNKYQKEIDSDPGSVVFVRFRAWAAFHFFNCK